MNSTILPVPLTSSPEQISDADLQAAAANATTVSAKPIHRTTSLSCRLPSEYPNPTGAPYVFPPPSVAREGPDDVHVCAVAKYTAPTRADGHVLDGSRSSGSGPPPPSPPESIEQIPDSAGDNLDGTGQEMSANAGEHPVHVHPHASSRPVTFEEPTCTHKRDLSSSSQASRILSKTSSRPLHVLSHRASADAKSLRSVATIARSLSGSNDRASEVSVPDSVAPPSADSALPPPPSPSPMTPKREHPRRNTIGSTTPFPLFARPSRPRINTMNSLQHLRDSSATDRDSELGALATDIEIQAEQIRREKIAKRIKAAQDAEQAKAVRHETEQAHSHAHVLTRTASLARAFSNRGEEGPLVGNLIGEGHANYVLMYNMLTGIRVAVSRCQAKIRRPLTNEDFKAANKYSFDIVGNELTPSAKYDFKFKDYAPWVFRELRERYFQLDPADYLLSLTAKYILSELGSPGKSGSFFYFSRDYRFIIKTIRPAEHTFLRRILPAYHAHVARNPHTLLSRFYGLHRVKLPRGRKIHFVIMNNLFPSHKDVHETYDLKGSTVGREYPEERARENPRAVLKDLNWIRRGRRLELGPEKRTLLLEQIRRDAELLAQLRVMDYSLLVGVHIVKRGNRDNVRGSMLKVFSPEVPQLRRKATSLRGPLSPNAIATRRVVRESDLQQLGATGTGIALPEEDAGDRQHLLFYQDDGGLHATDEANTRLETIYYLGIIDILTPYSLAKRMEHTWKGIRADRHKISPVPPTEYGNRFFAFMQAIMRGGDGGERFKAE